MKRFAWLAWSVMVSCGGAMSLGACGDDDDGTDTGLDGGDGVDARLPDGDVSEFDGATGNPETGTPDAHVPDAGKTDARAPDGGDAGDAGDAGHDSGTLDAGDAGPDSGKTDAGPDAGPDSGVDAGACGKMASGTIGAQMPRTSNVIVPTISYSVCSTGVHATDIGKPPVPAGVMGSYKVPVAPVNGFFRITGGDVHTSLGAEINGALFDIIDPMLPLTPFGSATPGFDATKAVVALFYGKRNDVDKPCSIYNATVVLNNHPEAVLKFADEDGNALSSPPPGNVDAWALYTNVDPTPGYATFTITPNDPTKCVIPAVSIFTGRIPLEANAVSFSLPQIDKKK